MPTRNKPIIRPCPECGRDYEYRRSSGRTFKLCETCRQPDCAICGKKVPPERGRKKTCCNECATILYRDNQNRHYAKRIALDPDLNKRHHAAAKARRAEDPEKMAAHKAALKARHERRKHDPRYIAERKHYLAKWYANNATEIQAKRAEFWDSLQPDEQERRRIARRESSRESKRRFYQKIADNPEALAEYKQRQREALTIARRQRALNKLMQQTQELINAAQPNPDDPN